MRSDVSRERRKRVVISILLVALGMSLYLGFLSTNYDLNGITELRAIEQGMTSLFPPNHMLYRPVVWLIYKMLQAGGYRGRSILPAQVTTAVSGALGLGLFYWWLRRLINCGLAPVIASLGFGTSWAYWVFSTDAFYIVPAATIVVGSLIVLSVLFAAPGPHPPMPSLVGLGMLCALAVLMWQANVFFLPIPLVVLCAKYKRDTRSLFVALLVFVATVSVVVGGVYLFVGVFVLEHRTVPSILEWLLRYGARLPAWGRWEIGRLSKAAISSLSSLIPVWEGLGLRALLKGRFQPDKLLSQVSMVALALLFLLPLLRQLRRPSLSASSHRLYLLVGLVLGYAIYLPFIAWWDPFEPKWFVIPNIGLWAILAVLWGSIIKHLRHVLLFAGLIVTIAAANLSATVWPRHSSPNVLLIRAECVAEHMEAEDSFAALEWGWPGYVSYFFQRQVFSLIDASARYGGKEGALDLLQQNISLTHRRGGKVYMVDFDTYPPEHLHWLASQTGLNQEDFQRIERTPAFVCDEVRFQEMDGVRR